MLVAGFIGLIVLCCSACGLSVSPRSDLASTNQETRDTAAKLLRQTYVPSPRTNWDSLIESLQVGMSKTNVLQILKPVIVGLQGATTSGTFEADQFRLDDSWLLECYFDHGFQGCKLFPSTFAVWVEPPPKFTGTWTTYFVNGQKSYEARYKDGKIEGETTFYDDGSKLTVSHLINSGTEVEATGYFRSGKVSYRGTLKTNEMVGTWIWFNEDGTVKSTQQHPIR